MKVSNSIALRITCFTVIVLACIFKHGENLGQGDKNCHYMTWVKLNNNLKTNPGYLYTVDTESIHLGQFPKSTRGKSTIMDEKIFYKDISQLKVRKRGAVGKGVLIGTLIGCAFGAILGYATEPSDSFIGKDGAALVAGILFTPIGMGLGAAIGSARTPVPIEKNPDRYYENENILRPYVIKERIK